MTKAVAKTGGKDLAKESDFSKFMDDNYDDGVDNEDLIMPRVKIVQAMTQDKMGAKEGSFIHTINGDLGTPIEFFILLTWKSRILFEKGALNIKCRSMDGKISGQGEFAGKLCDQCPKSKWDGNKKPECSIIYNYIIALKKELLDCIKTGSILPPTSLSMMSSATKVAKYINTNIRINKGRKKPIWADLISLSTEEKAFEVGKAFIPVAKIGATVSQDEVKEYLHKLRQTYMDMNLHEKLREEEVINEDVDQAPNVPDPAPAEGDDLDI